MSIPYSQPLASSPSASPDSELEDALRTLDNSRGLAESAEEGLPEHIIRILPHAQATAEGKVDRLNELLEQHAPELKHMLVEIQRPSLSRRARVEKLRTLAHRLSEILTPLTACAAQQCSHCCHIPVALTETEAAIIGEAVGKKPRKVSAKRPLSQEYGYHRPCPFLKNNRCSIYKDRPFACRTHLSLDVSDRLCALLQGVTVPVPLVDMSQYQMLYVQATGPEKLADIRDFFG